MEKVQFCTRYNIMSVDSIRSFAGLRGGYNQGCKDVYFVRCIGCNATYLEEIEIMDRQLAVREQQGDGNYIRIGELPRIVETSDIQFYKNTLKVCISWNN